MLAGLAARLRGLFRRNRANAEADEEIQFHLEMEIQANLARGMGPAEARRVALRDLGGVTQARESVREVHAFWFESTWQDVRYACRGLWRHPFVYAAAVVMLALGVGITTAMFTLVDSLVLRPVPFPEPDQLAHVYMGNEHGGRTVVAPGVLRAWQRCPAFSRAESAESETVLLAANGEVSTRRMARVTPGLFDLLGGVRPVRGRLFDAAEGRAGADDRVLISEDLWRSSYDADASIVGRAVTIDGNRMVVVGVLPAAFRFPSWDTAIWRPIDFQLLAASDAKRQAAVYVRFASSMPRHDALRLATAAARAADPATARLWTRVDPLADEFLDPYYRRAVPLLAGGVVLVFLVLCANVCNLLLARLTARQREFGMRSALGASRGRLARQALVESGVLGALGVALGTAIGWALVSLSRVFLPEALLLHTLNPLIVDRRALLATAVSGVAATLVAGLIPAWIGSRPNPDASLRVADRGGTETRGARLITRALLVGEIALACTLLVGATILVRSFVNLAGADRGLDADGVLVASMTFQREAFATDASRAAALHAIEAQIAGLPGVRQVAWSYGLPPDGGWTSYGKWRSDAPGAPVVNATVNGYAVGPGFFPLYGISLVRGRLFRPGDPATAVVVGERLAKLLWPGLDPIGRTFSFETSKEPYHVVGLVREIHFPSLDAKLDLPQYYVRLETPLNMAMMSVRSGPGGPSAGLLHQRILAAQPGVRWLTVRTLESVYFEELARPRAAAALAFAFAVVSVLAAAGGLFSVLSYAAGKRRREFGIRTALGASPGQIRRLVVREGAVVTLAGAAIGSAGAWLLARALVSLQYGVTIADPLTWATVLGLLAVTAIAAAWRPARQATTADPLRLLREE